MPLIKVSDLHPNLISSTIPDVKGWYRLWAKESTCRTLFSRNYDSVIPSLPLGDGELTGYFYIFICNSVSNLRLKISQLLNDYTNVEISLAEMIIEYFLASEKSQ